MGFQSRDYARTGPSVTDGVDSPVTRRLIIVTVLVYVAQLLLTRKEDISVRDILDQISDSRAYSEGPGLPEGFDSIGQTVTVRVPVIQEWLQLDTGAVLQGQVWRLLTTAFCHSREMLWHIAMNMFVLWWLGPSLETMYGSREFLCFYLLAAVVSSLAYVGLDLATGKSIPAIGASGAIMGVTAVFSYHFPTQVFRLFMLIPLEMRWLVWIYAIYDLHPVVLELSGTGRSDGVAHAAHLGGLAFGLLYSHRQWRMTALFDRRQRPKEEAVARVGNGVSSVTLPLKPAVNARLKPKSSETLPLPTAASQPPRLDDVLTKVHAEGLSSLTEQERLVLEQESQRLRQRKGQRSH